MSRATVELDFFGMGEKETSSSSTSSKSHLQKLFNRQGSFRGIHNAISKINPELLKSMMASGLAKQNSGGMSSSGNANFFPTKKSYSVPSTPRDQTLFPTLPVYTPIIRPTSESSQEIAPLTIFYNGTVSVFDLPQDKAENILKLALESSSADHQKLGVSTNDQRQLIETFNGDLPMARRKSLQRFLEKRKERLTWLSPYGCHAESAFLDQKPKGDPFRA